MSPLTIALGVGAITLFVIPQIREFLLIDACLDSGGRWAEREFQCHR